eukprot:103573-Rhodomonas_salina.1
MHALRMHYAVSGTDLGYDALVLGGNIREDEDGPRWRCAKKPYPNLQAVADEARGLGGGKDDGVVGGEGCRFERGCRCEHGTKQDGDGNGTLAALR